MALDLSTQQGKMVVRLLLVGLFALLCTYLLDTVLPQDEPLWLVITGFLLPIVAYCLVTAGRIARKMRRAG